MSRKKRGKHSPKREGALGEEQTAPTAPTSTKRAPQKLGSPFAALKGVKVPPRKKRAPVPRKASELLRDGLVRRGSAAPLRAAPDEPAMTEYSETDRVAFAQVFGGLDPVASRAERRRARRGNESQRLTPTESRRESAKSQSEAAERAARMQLDRLVSGGVRVRVERDPEGGVIGLRDGAARRTAMMLQSGDLPPEVELDLHGLIPAKVAMEVNRFVRAAHRTGRRTLLVIHGKGKHSEGGLPVLGEALIKALTDGGATPLLEAFATAPDRWGGTGAMMVRLRAR